MTTQVHVLLGHEDFSVAVRWKDNQAPENNIDLMNDLYGLPNTLILPSFGETSLIVDGGQEIDVEQVRRLFHEHGYETAAPAVI